MATSAHDATGYGPPNIMSNCHTDIGADFVGPDRPRGSSTHLQNFGPGSSSHESPIIIFAFFCPRMRFIVPKKQKTVSG